MMPKPVKQEFDVVVIGAGAVGENVADRVAQGGLSVVLIEAELVGGECSYWACMPSKALLRPGTALHAAQTTPGAKEAVTRTLDAAAVLKRRDYFTSNWEDGSQVAWVKDSGIELIRGHAWLTAPRIVQVAGLDGTSHHLEARHAVVLATGSVPTMPGIKGLEDLQVWGTREATSAREVPERLAVLGGGVAGTELAQAFARLGSSVTLVARSGLLGKYPQEAAALVAAGLRADGVEIRLNTVTDSITENDDGTFSLQLGDASSVTADKVLVATGRHPALEGLGLESVGFEPDDDGHLSLATDTSGLVQGTRGGQAWLYAVGDAAGRNLLTHQGKYEARATGDAIAARARGELSGTPEDWSAYAQTANDHAVPNVVFTDPELATVGRTLAGAREDGFNASSVELPIQVAGSSLHSENYEGWAQLVVDEDRQVLLGATFAGPDVSELLHAATIAVVGEVPLNRLWHAVPSYPTISEVWLRLLEKYGL
ncbi:pyruvate/2-oxoglutarate dehydrogenase complex, dihydrolipoamide dehydrogenase component [Pseudarthrobacter phenanthrenivorans Sphe3]|uniref:Pyruvate/2-oxoglutarate dehydrogenase complex, dihydrolipoamide dehydrogenase component n=2 Tax=Pseudarthrobacter phenanthrenivorans TaxID=361575 RepID=F0M143_PSEPM|nr:NAD(P)/FAD-dependent oxidoreductase [Pseudarthrobacter phenanthrenivorans]ADX71926.1 pyruvate/2-oxoglutarate dehydrogenase complex, dihydrolipoamide dehydrogenase component [Pseudarthrobacter phenanthrenivorans Sphe3]